MTGVRRTGIAIFVAASVLAAGVDAPSAQPRRVDPGARDILSYRLTADNLKRFTDVTRAMEKLPPAHPPEGARPDVAMLVVLSMASSAPATTC